MPIPIKKYSLQEQIGALLFDGDESISIKKLSGVTELTEMEIYNVIDAIEKIINKIGKPQ